MKGIQVSPCFAQAGLKLRYLAARPGFPEDWFFVRDDTEGRILEPLGRVTMIGYCGDRRILSAGGQALILGRRQTPDSKMG